MHRYKRLIIFILLSSSLFSAIQVSAEEESSLSHQFEQIEVEEKEILDLVSKENDKIKRARIKEMQRLEEIAIKKHQLEEKQRQRDERAVQRLVEEDRRLEIILSELEQLKILEAKKRRERRITAHIDLSQQKMKVYKGDSLLHSWRVSTARKGYVTPVGNYKPQSIERMHYSRRYHNSPMPYSIFFKGNFAIHGTGSIRKLGRRASHGCIRLHPKNAKKLYALVRKYGKNNTFIKITY